MRAETVTLLPMARYFEVMRIPTCHGAGIDGAKAPLKGGCDDLWDQGDREDLAATIAEAELLITEELGTWPAPTWITNEEIKIGRVRSDWWNAEFKTKWKNVIAFGTQTLTAIDVPAPVEYQDLKTDGYGREETALIGEPGAMYYYPLSACADVCSVKVFFTESSGAFDTADPRWEIRPLRPDIEPPGMVIRAESCLFLRPALQEQQWKEEWPDGSDEWWSNFDTDNLVDEVDVYCEGTNLNLPITLYWEGVCNCGAPCAHETQTACAYVTDLDRGSFMPRPATGANAWTAALYSHPPTKMTINYRAGWPLNALTCRMDRRLEQAIVSLTNALLPEPPCGFCDLARRRWKDDRDPVDPLIEAATAMPWDLFSKGAYKAYKTVKRLARGHGGSVRGSR